MLKGVIPCVNSLRSISDVFKLIHLSVSSSSNYTSVKCHLSQLSLTRVMSSSQPLRRPKWSLHCLEPAGSGCGMEEWAGSPFWEANGYFQRWIGGGGVGGWSSSLFSPLLVFLRVGLVGSKSVFVHHAEPLDSSGLVKSLPWAKAFICMSLIWPVSRLWKELCKIENLAEY